MGCDFYERARMSYEGPEYSHYDHAFEIAVGTVEDFEAQISPIMECADPDLSSDEEFAACASEWVQVDAWLRQMVAEAVIPIPDGLIDGAREYLMYFSRDPAQPHGGRLFAYAWDVDSAYFAPCRTTRCNVIRQSDNDSAPTLVYRLAQVWHRAYCDTAQAFIDTVYSEAAAQDAVDRIEAIVEPYVDEDPDTTRADWEDAVQDIRDRMAERIPEAQDQITDGCR